MPPRGGCLTIEFYHGRDDVCDIQVGLMDAFRGFSNKNRKRSQNDVEKIYFARSKRGNGSVQTKYVTVPPPRGGCPLKTVCWYLSLTICSLLLARCYSEF